MKRDKLQKKTKVGLLWGSLQRDMWQKYKAN